jgi:hypothetical protein
VKEVYEKNKVVFNVVAGVIAVLFSLLVYQQSSASIQNLTSASDDVLKGVFAGDKPYAFYCMRGTGKDEAPHPLFSELNKALGGKYGFAMVNCNHKLPSGKTILDRFALNRKTKPIIFLTAPWFGGRAKQVTGAGLKDAKTSRKYVDAAMTPRAMEVSSDKELYKYCGWGKSSVTHDDKSIGTSCIAIVKGKRHAKAHMDLEERIIRENPRQRYVSVNAAKRRLSFEDPESMPADAFAIKVHAMRNGTHHISMVNPATWDYLSTFVSHAIGTPLYDFEEEESSEGKQQQQQSGIKLKKLVPSRAFRDRSQSQQQQQQQQPRDDTAGDADTYEGDGMTKAQKKARRERLKKQKTAGAGAGAGGAGGNSDTAAAEPAVELTPEEVETARLEKEARAREYVFCYAIVLPLFLLVISLSLSHPSIAPCLSALSHTTWHESNHHYLNQSINNQSINRHNAHITITIQVHGAAAAGADVRGGR